MKAEVITIGDEILIGQIVDTNSSWLAEQLSLINVEVIQISSIKDEAQSIESALSAAEKRADLILLTGGLGPTKDDITKKTLYKYFNSTPVFNDDVLENIEKLFNPRGIPILEGDREQSMVPHNCEVLLNRKGTAPGMWFQKEEKIYISMPGVPYEMKVIFNDHVIPKIKQKLYVGNIIHRTILTHGLGEGLLADKIESWEDSLKPLNIKLAYLPSIGQVRLRLSAFGNKMEIIDEKIGELQRLIPDLIFGYEKQTMQGVLGEMLTKRKMTVSTAESCTGGTIASMLTSISGSSEYFKGSVVAYSNEIKSSVLGVEEGSLKQYGAVSQPVVEQMAIGVQRRLKTDFAIATSGIAGPTGATEGKPVGMIWVAVANSNQVISRVFQFGKNRAHNITMTSIVALNMLRLQLIENNEPNN